MAKPTDKPVTGAAQGSTFRDKRYTSRTLILPKDGRSLEVLKGQVSVPAADTDALDYLDSHEEFEQQQE